MKLGTLKKLVSRRWVRTLCGRARVQAWQQLLADPLIPAPLVLVYQMPKVGSQTVEATLQAAGWPGPVFRLHYLSPGRREWCQRELERETMPETYKADIRWQLDLLTKLSRIVAVRRRLIRFRVKVPKFHVIAAVREPIGLALSALFETPHVHFPSVDGITTEACRRVLLKGPLVQRLQSWFDAELKPMIGIDVYRTVFPHERGCAKYENRCARALVYRFESLGRIQGILQDFLAWTIPEVVTRNLGRTKAYGELYERVKGQLRLPAAFVKEQYDTPMMRHFYTAEERLEFQRRWTEEKNCLIARSG